MPFPRPAARPWSGFDLADDQEAPPPLSLALPLALESSKELQHLLRLTQKAHAAERAAALAYRGHRACFRDVATRRFTHGLAVDEWRHRAWLRRRLMPRLGIKPNPWYEAFFLGIGLIIGLACQFIGPFLASYFAGRLERDNGAEYDCLAVGLRVLGMNQRSELADQPGQDLCLRHMARVERRHERDLLALVRRHPWLPWFAQAFRWPLPERAMARAAKQQAVAPRKASLVLALS